MFLKGIWSYIQNKLNCIASFCNVLTTNQNYEINNKSNQRCPPYKYSRHLDMCMYKVSYGPSTLLITLKCYLHMVIIICLIHGLWSSPYHHRVDNSWMRSVVVLNISYLLCGLIQRLLVLTLLVWLGITVLHINVHVYIHTNIGCLCTILGTVIKVNDWIVNYFDFNSTQFDIHHILALYSSATCLKQIYQMKEFDPSLLLNCL